MDIPKIGITMIGGSRTGKTCYLCAMAHEMALPQNGFTFSPNMLDFRSDAAKNARKLNAEWRSMQHVYDESGNIIQRGRWLEGTDKSKDFDFLCSYAGRPLATFLWHDYRGGNVHGNVQVFSDEELEVLFKRISDSSCLIVCIAAERLQALIHGSGEAADEFGVYAGYLQNYRAVCDRTVPVVFTITKADKLAPGEFAKGVELLRTEIFSQFFQPGYSEDWFMMFVGVCLGEFEESADGLIYGEFGPVNIHLPVLFAVRCALLQRMQASQGSLDSVRERAGERESELNRENNRTFLGRLFHQQDRETIRRQLQTLDSSRAAIESEITRLTADIKALTKELIGNDPDVVQLYLGGRRAKID